jgi:hypothetical protein
MGQAQNAFNRLQVGLSLTKLVLRSQDAAFEKGPAEVIA